jgi:hypothetical protein
MVIFKELKATFDNNQKLSKEDTEKMIEIYISFKEDTRSNEFFTPKNWIFKKMDTIEKEYKSNKNLDNI